MKIDDISITILKMLSKEGKKKDTEISRETGIPTSTINKKRIELQESGFLKIYGIPNYKSMGMLELIYGIDVSQGKNDEVAEALGEMKGLIRISHTMGDHSIVAEAVVADMDAAKELGVRISRIPNVRNLSHSIVVNRTKEDCGSAL